MFEIGFQEILLIFVIALVVLGPERLPKLVAQVGRWAGKAKAMARQFREQLESEINLDELNKASKSQPKAEQPQPWTDSPAAEAPVPDPSAPAPPATDTAVDPMAVDSIAADTAPVPDKPYVAPADDFAHHATADAYPYSSPEPEAVAPAAASPAEPPAQLPAEPERSTAENPVVSTHERL
jgi:sec-independent protein translocase protein TatB